MSRLATPSMGISILALVISLSGGAYAATQLAPNSVGTAQIRDNAVTAPKIANGAVTRFKIASGAVNGSRVADNSLTGADVDESTLDLPGAAGGAVTLAGVDFHPRDSTVTSRYLTAGGILGLSELDVELPEPLPVGG